MVWVDFASSDGALVAGQMVAGCPEPVLEMENFTKRNASQNIGGFGGKIYV